MKKTYPLTANQKFNLIIEGLAYDLQAAWNSANFMERHSNWTAAIDPENMIVLEFIVKVDCKGHESFNSVAHSIMSGKRKFEWQPLRNAVVDVFEIITNKK